MRCRCRSLNRLQIDIGVIAADVIGPQRVAEQLLLQLPLVHLVSAQLAAALAIEGNDLKIADVLCLGQRIGDCCEARGIGVHNMHLCTVRLRLGSYILVAIYAAINQNNGLRCYTMRAIKVQLTLRSGVCLGIVGCMA